MGFLANYSLWATFLTPILFFASASCTSSAYREYQRQRRESDMAVKRIMAETERRTRESKMHYKSSTAQINTTKDLSYIQDPQLGSQVLVDLKQLNPISINPQTENLPKNYQGDDIVKAFNRLKKEVPGKDKYETTDQYRKRIDRSKVENDLYAFQVTHTIGGPIETSYDADNKKLKIYMSHMDHALTVKKIDKRTKYTRESNAFGVTVEVRTRLGTRYEIALANDYSRVNKKVGGCMPA